MPNLMLIASIINPFSQTDKQIDGKTDRNTDMAQSTRLVIRRNTLSLFGCNKQFKEVNIAFLTTFSDRSKYK